MTDVRRKILLDYGRWTALSALRRAPVRSRAVVYPLLDAVAFDRVLRSEEPISATEFDRWHEEETTRIEERNRDFGVGWAAKLLNVYLKTVAYVGDFGRPGLRDVIHPPIDAGLWSGLARKFRENLDRLRELRQHQSPITALDDYPKYLMVITWLRGVARDVPCSLVELEQFWLGSATPPVG